MSTITAPPGTVVVTRDAKDWFDLHRVLGFDLDDQRRPEHTLWVAEEEFGLPSTLYDAGACQYNGMSRALKVFYPPVTREDVLTFIADTLRHTSYDAYEEAVALGARYEPARGGKPSCIQALYPRQGDRWLAPPEAEEAIALFEVKRCLAASARSGDATALHTAASEETWTGGLGGSLLDFVDPGWRDRPAVRVAS